MSGFSTEDMELVKNDACVASYPKLVDFEENFRNPEEHVPWKNAIHQAIKKQIGPCNVRKSLLKLFPFVETLKSYSVKEDLPNDIIAGLTSGVMMIPQGMAFAALSTLPPIVGLYISFFASVTYFFLGTGRQLSWGCIAILSLMMATVLDKYDNSLLLNTPHLCINETVDVLAQTAFNHSSGVPVTVVPGVGSNSSNFSAVDAVDWTSSDANMAMRIQVASAVTIVAAIVLLFASMLGLSRITCLMSNSMITGYTVGLSFLVATSQLKIMFGIRVSRYIGPGAVIRTWVSVLSNLPKTNVATLITSIISILVLFLVKKFINDRYKKRLRIPIPIELIVVVAATLISKFAFLHDSFSVAVVETIPVGIPAPSLPDLTLATDYITDGIVIIIIAYAQTVAMAKTLGLKNNYVVDSNQEMFACSVCNIISGLFSGFLCSCSVSRSLVQEGAGGKTQVASLFAAGVVLLVIMLIGPFFYYLPICVLSAITVVNLQAMFLKLLDIPGEWRKSRYDCAVWVFACISCIIFNADVGLLAGILFSMSLIALRAIITPVVEAGQIQTSSFTVELRSLEKYSVAKQLHSIIIIKIVMPLYFINADIFTANVFSKTGIDSIKLNKQRKDKTIPGKDNETSNKGGPIGSESQDQMLDEASLSRVVILDASGVAFIDLMGVQALQFLINEFTSVGVEVLITSVPESIISMLKSTGFWSKNGDRLFLSVEAAMASIVTVNKNIEQDTSSTNNTMLQQNVNVRGLVDSISQPEVPGSILV